MPSRPRRSARRRDARRRRVRMLIGAVTFLAVVVGGTAAVVSVLNHSAEPLVPRCAASLDGTDWYLEPDQADTAALLAGTALSRDLPARALTIAIATGLQESNLRNLDHGDRDSVGIFQQRPSQGWGSVEQIMDPVYATNAFYDALVRVDGYQEMTVTEAAQTVQRSAFPEAYAQHEPRARAWASAMYGYSGGTVTCTFQPATGPGDPADLVVRAERDLPSVTATVTATGVLLDAAPLSGSADQVERLGWAVAHWAVLVAGPLEVNRVSHAGSVWERDTGNWTTQAAGYPAGTVVVELVA